MRVLQLTDRLRRLTKAYIDGMVPDVEYEGQKQQIQEALALDGLAVPGQTEALNPGTYLANLPGLWKEATTSERWSLLSMLLDAVYCDVKRKTLVGVKPKPPFAPIFELIPMLMRAKGASDELIGDPDGIRTHDLHRDRVACLAATPRGRKKNAATKSANALLAF